MKKRIKEKLGNRNNLLKRAERQIRKRKGNKYLAYDLVPIGDTDKMKFVNDGYTSYPYATHWFLEIVHNPYYYGQPYVIQIYPSTETGKTDRQIAVQLNSVENFDNLIPLYNKIVEDMENDRFWDSDYATLFE